MPCSESVLEDTPASKDECGSQVPMVQYLMSIDGSSDNEVDLDAAPSSRASTGRIVGLWRRLKGAVQTQRKVGR